MLKGDFQKITFKILGSSIKGSIIVFQRNTGYKPAEMIFNASWFDSPVVLHSLLILNISQRLKILKDTKNIEYQFFVFGTLCAMVLLLSNMISFYFKQVGSISIPHPHLCKEECNNLHLEMDCIIVGSISENDKFYFLFKIYHSLFCFLKC